MKESYIYYYYYYYLNNMVLQPKLHRFDQILTFPEGIPKGGVRRERKGLQLPKLTYFTNSLEYCLFWRVICQCLWVIGQSLWVVYYWLVLLDNWLLLVDWLLTNLFGQLVIDQSFWTIGYWLVFLVDWLLASLVGWLASPFR